jgi:hypothetical protein
MFLFRRNKMQAVEFDSYIENGVIPVPLEYQNTIPHSSVRVIVLPKNTSVRPVETTGKKKLYSLDVDMSGFVFNRNEINER